MIILDATMRNRKWQLATLTLVPKILNFEKDKNFSLFTNEYGEAEGTTCHCFNFESVSDNAGWKVGRFQGGIQLGKILLKYTLDKDCCGIFKVK